MGTAGTTKVIKNNAGTLTEETTLITSSGAADANKVVALNASGILDDTILNATVTSSPNKMPKLDAAGKLDSSVMPTGIGADTAVIVASEALADGDLVNIWNNAGTANVRKADANSAGKEAHGFVLAAVASAASATVYFEGPNSHCTGLTPGVQFLSSATPGKTGTAAPTGTGKIVQKCGIAINATTINFESGDPIVLA